MVLKPSLARLLFLAVFLAALQVHAQKDPDETGDQPLVRFPLIQLKANLLAPAFGNYDFEGEVQTSPRWSFSARVGSTRSFEDLKRVGEYRCLVDQGFGFAVAARYRLTQGRPGQGLGLKGTLFRSRHREREWQCMNPQRPLRNGSDTGLGLHLTYQKHLLGAIFIEPFIGLNLAFSEYEIDDPTPRTERGVDLQVPVGFMLGFGF